MKVTLDEENKYRGFKLDKNTDIHYIGELQEHYEIGISIYNDLEECNPDIAYLVKEFKYWGHDSICLWLANGKTYKCTRLDKNNFYMQYLSKEDIYKKYKQL